MGNQTKKRRTRDCYTDELFYADKDGVKGYDGYFHKKYAHYSKELNINISDKSPTTIKDDVTGELIDSRVDCVAVITGHLISEYIIGTTLLSVAERLCIPIYSTIVESGRRIGYAKSIKIAKDAGFIESIYDGIFYKRGSSFKISKLPIVYRKFELPKINKSSKEDLLKYGIVSQTHLISEGKDYTFGVEIETCKGYIPPYIASELNMSSVYDGSVRDDEGRKNTGGEYVTGVLSGDNGLKHLYKITNELGKRCSINKTCSVHVHVGGLIFNKATIVSLWKLNQQLEAELYSMMPVSRLTREHCKQMKKIKFNFNTKKSTREFLIDRYFNEIFEIISLGHKPSKTINRKFNHPSGSNCGYNTRTPRYWWLNFVPTLFNLKGEGNSTIEFRMHSATLNFTKIKNWVLIVFGIVYFAENYQKEVFENDKITLEEVMLKAYPSKGKYLSKYIEERKKTFNSARSSLFESAEYDIDRNSNKSGSITLNDTLWA